MPVQRMVVNAAGDAWVPIDGGPSAPFTPLAPYDWSESRLPWAYSSTSAWTQYLPAGVTVTPISTASGDFHTNLTATCNAASGRVIVELDEGVYELDQFRLLGSSGDPTYSFGFYHQKLAGLIGKGPDKTFVQMAGDSMTEAQLTALAAKTQASFSPNQMGIMRIDTQYSSAAAPIFLGGITFRADHQNELESISGDITNNVYVPQPAPHQGVVVYSDSSRRHSSSIIAFCRFQGAGKAMTSQPPFEHANITSQRNHLTFRNCEFDGRISPDFDASRPRKCGPWMGNGGVEQHLIDCWLHHSNVSRYAANDESVVSSTALSNKYYLTRCKLDQITNNQNRQPPRNDGQSLGGYTNASCCGWESSNADIQITDCIMSVDNTQTSGQIPCHLQLTNTGAARSGGRLKVIGGSYRNTGFPDIDGYVTFRIQSSSNWWTDGFATTLDVRKTAGGATLTAHQYTGTWPPSPSYLSTNSLSPDTHYIVRST